MIDVEFANRQSQPVDARPLIEAVRRVLAHCAAGQATVSLAVVSDPEIHEINRRFLAHDEPTDVISFVLEDTATQFTGEIVVSLDTAAREAVHYGWSVEAELLLYVIHGALHLAGYDDTSPALQAEMRAQERRYLQEFGLTPSYASDDDHGQ